ncbi:MAG: Dna2/Cas4 domain-containing protein [Erysipelotrichaceae bacterium]|nr:Dna2/Cas4 domain-containing protein [Erysipelotrichaceae bacterium]
MIKHTIVLTSTYKNVDTLKSLAALGNTSFNVRYMSTLELARHLLMLSGKVIKSKFISNDDLAALLYHDVKKIPYFEKLTYNDILGLIDSINDLRRCIPDDERKVIIDKLPKDEFQNKNAAIIEFYDLFIKTLTSKDNNFIDEVGTIRYAYENISSFPNIDFVIYEGDRILDYKLDMALLAKASGRDIVPTKINEGVPLHIDSYTKSFSQDNEIEDILDYIYKHDLPFDQCLIAASEIKDYSNILNNYHDLLGFPLTIGVGDNIIETHPGRLFSIVNDYMDNNYHVDYLKKVIYDECFNIGKFKEEIRIPDSFDDLNKGVHYHHQISFDTIVTTVGDLRLSFDEKSNEEKLKKYLDLLDRYTAEKIDEEDIARRVKEIPFVTAFKDVLNKGLLNFINEYCYIVDESADENARDKVVKGLTYERKYSIPHSDIVKNIFLQNVGKRSPKPGTLYFTSIANASSVLRKHLFVVGLSSNNFPGKRKEDPILLDRDYEAFGVNNASNRAIENNKNSFFNLLALANKQGSSIHLSYASYNSVTLKTQNASSVVFEAYQKENGVSKTIKNFEDEFKNNKNKFRTVEFFMTNLLPIADIGRAVTDNKQVDYDKPNPPDPNRIIAVPLTVLNKALSASDIEIFVQCPYMFYLSRILKVEQPEDVDIFELIPANDYGTLAHSLLEGLNKSKTSLDEFLKISGDRFDDYFIIHHTDNIPLKINTKKEFLEMMKNAYDMEETSRNIREKEIYAEYEDSGIKIHGFPDKVVMNSNGEGYVVDYKTGRKVKHSINDLRTLIQCIVYSYLVEKKRKIPVVGFEFRYLRTGDRISIAHDPQKMGECYLTLDSVIKEIKNCYDSGSFPSKSNKKVCGSCFYRDVCMKRM